MPEFPLSRPDLKQTEEPREYRGRSGMDFEGARHWRLVQVSRYANLQPSQIVREMDAPDRGWDPSPATGDEHAPRSERQDATADADRQRENTSLVTVDERRYVVDPIVDGHTFTGLWTGGPILHVVSQGRKVLRQTLTRTWCAGHGYTVAKDGAYIAEWPASFDETTGAPTSWTETTPEGYGGVHGTSGNKDKEHSDAPPVREYRTAKDCLKACRPWMDGKLSPYMAFRTDIPASFYREVYWREFTHESITPLESLTRAELVDVVGYHFGGKVAGTVMDAHTRVDPQTNTVIFVCSLLYTELAEPKTPDELLELPVIDAPCTRDTLRMFGWGQLRDGEGYEYTHVFRWPRLKDSETTRRTIEFVKDNAGSLDSSFLPNLLAKHYHPEIAEGGTKPDGWWAGYETVKPIHLDGSATGESAEKDNTGRLVTQVDTGTYNKTVEQNGATSQVPAVTSTPSVQHYRIAQQKVDVEQDGSLTFTIAISKAEWHGYDDGEDYESGGRRQLASVSAPQGYGITEHRVIPSVPRESAIPTMKAIEPRDDYEIVVETRQTEGQSGSSDVSFQRKRLYDFIDGSHVPENIVNVDNNPFNATTYNYDPNSNTYHLGWTYVSPAGLQNLVDSVRKKLGGNPVVRTEWHPEGYYSVRITAKGKEPKHVREWMVAADWFKHETLEQWIGVTVKTRQTPGQDDDPSAEILGFYTRYQRDPATGEYIVDSEGNLVPDEESFVYFREIRGDLDANWMGSDPQDTGTAGAAAVLDPTTGAELTPAVLATNGGAADAPTMFVTCGAANGGEGTKYPLVGDFAPSHADQHGNGWSGATWDDPDFGDGDDSAGDSADKKRSHVLTRVHPRRNDDGSYDISISRIYPHQRYWEWTLPSMDSDGDEYDTRHFSYHNWPSRKAIKQDIIDRIKAEVQSDWDDGWAIGGSFSVNQFGLIDAPNCSLVPTKGNGKARVARARTIQEYFQYEQQHPVRSYKAPSGKDPKKVPPNGYWEKVDVWTIEEGYSTDYQYAKNRIDAYSPLYEGSRGIWRANNKHGIQSAWAWHVVTYIEPGEWDGEDLPQGGGNGSTGSDGNNSTVDSGGDGESGGGESGGGET